MGGPCDSDVSRECATPNLQEVISQAPNLLMVIDQSGSMSGSSVLIDGSSRTLWAVAEQVTKELASWSHHDGDCAPGSSPRSCDRVRMGLHFWSDTTRAGISPGEGTTAGAVGAAWGSATGATFFHLGTELIRSEPALDTADSANAAVFVTDGKPTDVWTTRRAVRDLCALRLGDDGARVATYTMGFGGATNEELNALLGAAGGTQGSCTLDGQPKDPCDYYQYEQAHGATLWSVFWSIIGDSTQQDRFNALYDYLDSVDTGTAQVNSLNAQLDLALDWALMRKWHASGTDAQRQWVRDMENTLSRVVRQPYHRDVCWYYHDGNWYGYYCDPGLAESISSSDWHHLARVDWYDTQLTDGFACSGGITATSGEALREELLSVFGNLQCTFPLNLLAGTISAPQPVQFTHVKLNLPFFGLLTVPHVSDSAGRQSMADQLNNWDIDRIYSPVLVGDVDGDFGDAVDGWDWSNPGRTAVQLRGDTCGLVGADFVSSVRTQVCRPCPNEGDVCTVEGQQGRCRGGIVTCDLNTGIETCESAMRPMPEICNGVDDDCDGRVDDLSRNERDWSSSQWSLEALQNRIDTDASYGGAKPQVLGYYCAGRDACGCRGGEADEHGGTGSTATEEFENYLVFHVDNRRYCGCGEGLSVEPAVAPAPTDGVDEELAGLDGQAACGVATAGGMGTGSGLWYALIALVGLGRRRRRGR